MSNHVQVKAYNPEPKPPKAKRPSTRTLTKVLYWMAELDLRVYGPVIDEKTGEIWDESGYQDYSLQHMLTRWKAIKREENTNG